MKKTIIVAVLLFIRLSGFSQTGIYSGGLWNTSISLRNKGLIVRPEVGYVLNNGFNIRANFGSQVTRQFFVGGGLGVEFKNTGYNSSTGTSGVMVNIPIFANARCYLTKSVSSPFLEMNFGVRIRPEENSSEVNLYYTPAIGYDIMNFDIKVEFPNFEGVGFFIGYNIGFK